MDRHIQGELEYEGERTGDRDSERLFQYPTQMVMRVYRRKVVMKTERRDYDSLPVMV